MTTIRAYFPNFQQKAGEASPSENRQGRPPPPPKTDRGDPPPPPLVTRLKYSGYTLITMDHDQVEGVVKFVQK